MRRILCLFKNSTLILQYLYVFETIRLLFLCLHFKLRKFVDVHAEKKQDKVEGDPSRDMGRRPPGGPGPSVLMPAGPSVLCLYLLFYLSALSIAGQSETLQPEDAEQPLWPLFTKRPLALEDGGREHIDAPALSQAQDWQEGASETKEDKVLRQAGRALESAIDAAIAPEAPSQLAAAASASAAAAAVAALSSWQAQVKMGMTNPAAPAGEDGGNERVLPSQPIPPPPHPPSAVAPNQSPSSSFWAEAAAGTEPGRGAKTESMDEEDSEADGGSDTASSDGWSIRVLDIPADGMVYVRSDQDPAEVECIHTHMHICIHTHIHECMHA
jgi:hypothetical protein